MSICLKDNSKRTKIERLYLHYPSSSYHKYSRPRIFVVGIRDMKNIRRIFFFVGISSIVAAWYLTWQRDTPNRLSFKTESVGSALAYVPSTMPVRIDIKRLCT